MNHFHPILVLSLLSASIAHTQVHAQTSDAESIHERTPPADASPLAGFAIMEEGQWNLGSIHADTWHWGPGKNSIRSHTVGADGDSNPWREIAVYYWHPGLEQIRVLSLHPDIPAIGRGIAEGSIEFDGQTFRGKVDLYQTGRERPVHRRLAHHWTFDGPDRYHETLLENTGRGYETLVEWDYVRSEVQPTKPTVPNGDAPLPSANLKPLLPLLGRWEIQTEAADDRDARARLNFEWAEYLDLIAVRLESAEAESSADSFCDAYLFHHVGTNSLRCLALTRSGGVYEGELKLLPDGTFESELKLSESGVSRQSLARLDFEEDGSLRVRVWTEADGKRALAHDVRAHRVDSTRK